MLPLPFQIPPPGPGISSCRLASAWQWPATEQKDEYFCEVQYGNGPYSTVYCISKLEIDRSRSRTNFVRLLNNAL